MTNVMNEMVGIVGVGRMGRAMWSRLTERGFDTIVYDVAPSARDGAGEAGAKVAASLDEVAANARTIVLSLPRSDDVEAAVLGDGGIADGLAGRAPDRRPCSTRRAAVRPSAAGSAPSSRRGASTTSTSASAAASRARPRAR